MHKKEDLIGFNRPKNAFEKDEPVDEETYVSKSTEYALETGLVREDEKDLLQKKYLIPIHQTYIETLKEVLAENANEPNVEQLQALVTKRLNAILGRTIRIGSTDPNNIMRSINEYVEWACKDLYTEYAAQSLATKVWEVLQG